MDDLAILFEKDAGWTPDAGSVDPCLGEMWEQYCGELPDFKFSVSRTPLEVVKIGRELLSSNNALSGRLRNAKTCEREAQAAREAADARLARAHSVADEVVELPKRQSASDMSLQKMTAELTKVKA